MKDSGKTDFVYHVLAFEVDAERICVELKSIASNSYGDRFACKRIANTLVENGGLQ